MRLERGTLTIEPGPSVGSGFDVHLHRDVDDAITLSLDELSWLVVAAGPALLVELRRGLEAAAPEPAPRDDDEAADGQPDLFAQANAELSG